MSEGKPLPGLSDRLLFGSFFLMFLLIPFRTSPHVIAGSLALAVWVFSGKIVRDRGRWLHEAWSRPVLCLILLPWLGLLWTDNMETGLRLATKSYYWLYAFAIVSVPENSRKWLVFALISGLTLNTFIAMGQLAGWVPMTKEFATGLIGGRPTHIVYSLFLVFGLLIFSFYFSSLRRYRHRLAILCLMALFLFNLVMVPGRIGYLSFILLSPLMIPHLVGRQSAIKIAVLFIVFCSVLLLSGLVRDRVSIAQDEVRKYFQTGDVATSIGGRFLMWDGAISMFLVNPVVGVGTGDYRDQVTEHTGRQTSFNHPHNNFLYMAACFGIMGVVVLSWYFIVVIRRGWQTRETLTGFLSLSFSLIVLIGGMTDTQIINQFTGVTLALFTGIHSGRR